MKKLAVLFALILASVVLVACGGSDNSSSSTEGGSETSGGGIAEVNESTIDFEADPNGQLAYTTTKTTGEAGKVKINFTNPQALPHDVAIEDANGETIAQTEEVTQGESDFATAIVRPGTYHYYCTVPGHREAGMEGTLIIKAPGS